MKIIEYVQSELTINKPQRPKINLSSCEADTNDVKMFSLKWPEFRNLSIKYSFEIFQQNVKEYLFPSSKTNDKVLTKFLKIK